MALVITERFSRILIVCNVISRKKSERITISGLLETARKILDFKNLKCLICPEKLLECSTRRLVLTLRAGF